MSTPKISEHQLKLAATTIGMLAADAVEKAKSGHPGMPMGAADYAVVLWLEYLKFNPRDPGWINRDRFVLSNGHGSMLLYALLYLCGYDVSLDDLKAFRQWDSITPGHPESHMTPGVECTTGPLGQGVSNAVGMAIGQKLMAERYNTKDFQPIDHRVFCFVGDGCLMEGVSSEASSVAGHLGLGNLNVIYDDNHISIAGHTELAFTEQVTKRYEAYGWHVQSIDGHNYAAIRAAMDNAVKETDRPSLIAARTIIGKGSPNKADTHDVHGSPLGKEELELTKKALEWPIEPMFYVPDEVKQLFAARVETLKSQYDSWKAGFSAWEKGNSDKAQALRRQLAREVPPDLRQKLLGAVPTDGKAISTRKLSSAVLQAASREVNSLVGGSADLEPSTLTLIKDSTDVEKNAFSGKNLRFGVREHGMGAIMNGLSYYGGYIPYGSTFLCFNDYMRPTLRLAALSHLQGLFIYTHESIFLGEDGPTHQPIEHVAAMRLVPNLWVLRPADGLETALCYEIALKRKDGPCALLFTRQDLPPLERPAGFSPDMIEKGAYEVFNNGAKGGKAQIVFVATGSEVSLAVESAKALGSGVSVSVVSMPCWELFMEQPEDFRRRLVPHDTHVVTVEAGTTTLWPGMLGVSPDEMLCVGIDHFGASAPAKVLAEKFGFTAQSVVARVRERFSLG